MKWRLLALGRCSQGVENSIEIRLKTSELGANLIVLTSGQRLDNSSLFHHTPSLELVVDIFVEIHDILDDSIFSKLIMKFFFSSFSNNFKEILMEFPFINCSMARLMDGFECLSNGDFILIFLKFSSWENFIKNLLFFISPSDNHIFEFLDLSSSRKFFKNLLGCWWASGLQRLSSNLFLDHVHFVVGIFHFFEILFDFISKSKNFLWNLFCFELIHSLFFGSGNNFF